MPEHIRALLVVLVVSSFVWLLARPAIVQIIPAATFSRWRMLWYVTTLAWFLAHSFWLYFCIMVVMLVVAGRREPHVFGLYLLLLLAAPAVEAPIPGFGIVDHIFWVDHYRMLALALLLPSAWRLSLRRSTAKFFLSPVDWMVVGYLLVNSALAFRGGNFTNDARAALMPWIDYFLPYYVASRSIQNTEDFRHALVGLLLGGLLLSLLALAEVMRSWKLYEAAAGALGLNTFGAYKLRGGLIRPGVTVIDSIVLGYVIVTAIGAYIYLQGLIKEPARRWLGWLALCIGVLASLSRGPWVGAVLLVVVFIMTGPRPIQRLMLGGLAASCLVVVLSAFSVGQQFIGLLPFVGESEQENVDYRADLLTVAIPVIERNLLFGAADYIHSPELEVMRQGEGIIDIVNSYLGVVLHAGIVGLFFFSGMFVLTLLVLRRGMRWARQLKDPDRLQLGRALFATLVSIMVIIFTLSGISVVPTLYFSAIGISTAYFLSQRALDRAKRLGAAR